MPQNKPQPQFPAGFIPDKGQELPPGFVPDNASAPIKSTATMGPAPPPSLLQRAENWFTRAPSGYGEESPAQKASMLGKIALFGAGLVPGEAESAPLGELALKQAALRGPTALAGGKLGYNMAERYGLPGWAGGIGGSLLGAVAPELLNRGGKIAGTVIDTAVPELRPALERLGRTATPSEKRAAINARIAAENEAERLVRTPEEFNAMEQAGKAREAATQLQRPLARQRGMIYAGRGEGPRFTDEEIANVPSSKLMGQISRTPPANGPKLLGEIDRPEPFVRDVGTSRATGRSPEASPALAPEEHAELERIAGRPLTNEEALKVRQRELAMQSAKSGASEEDVSRIREPHRAKLEPKRGLTPKPLGEIAPNATKPPILDTPSVAQTPATAAPSRTLNIGRGAHGPVRVEFPDTEHADLYSLKGRRLKAMRQGTGTPSNANASMVNYLSHKLGIPRDQVWDVADKYRDYVNQAIKGREEGSRFMAPKWSETKEK